MTTSANDPQALRALAHPLRWKLIGVLGREGSATSTRCAELTGESVASCAYHLGILTKYGYVEPVPERTGREKPWRLTDPQQRIGAAGDRSDPEMRSAAAAATDTFLEYEFAQLREHVHRRESEPAEWREASGIVGSSMWVTVEELAEIKAQLMEIALRYEARDTDPSLRPAGARYARVFSATAVEPDSAPTPGTADPAPAPASGAEQ